jgi:toxin ParE1/3/4
MSQDAERDAAGIRDYLESERTSYGQVFIDELRATLRRISEMPKSYAVLKRNVRAAMLHRFLYVAYYRIHRDRAEVIAVMHGHRHPDAWRSRLT